jgi:hypothetical protein
MWEPQPLANLRASTACTGITLSLPSIFGRSLSTKNDVTSDHPVVNLEETEDECEKTVMTFTAYLVTDNNRLSKLRNECGTDLLNSEESVLFIKI